MKKFAWTMAEMVIAIVVLLLLSGACLSVYKPGTQKAKIYVYAAIRNLTKGNIAVIEKNNYLADTDTVDGNDWYCLQLSDVFNLDAAAECARSTAADVANLKFSNGTTVFGIASAWIQPAGESYKYKDILIDIDGISGLNKLGADRFPLRIMAGTGKGVEGLIVPVNCGETNKSSYCGTSTHNYTTDSNVISYDIYKAVSTDENAKAKPVSVGLSFYQADCQAYGNATGYFGISDCSGTRIKTECATKTNCETCISGNCPLNTSGTATDSGSCRTMAETINPDNISCFTIIHKPSTGTSFLLQSVVGDIDDMVQ